MKPIQILPRCLLGCVVLMIVLSGCAAPSAQQASPAVAFVVRVAGGGRSLSPQEFNAIYRALESQLTDAGFSFARNADAADFLVTVRFTPDAVDLERGHVAVTGVEPNPLKRRRRVPNSDVSYDTAEVRDKLRTIENVVQPQAKRSS